jgi:calpain-15
MGGSNHVVITINGRTQAERPCCSKLCSGDLNPLINIICCPFVMIYQAFRVYLVGCCCVYTTWLLDTMFCAPFRMCCRCCSCCSYTDKSFPPEAKSIGPWEGLSLAQVEQKIKWVRATDHFQATFTEAQKKEGVNVKLYKDGIDPRDVAQGDMGDCWLIAALACLAEYEGLVKKSLTSTHYNPNGKYGVRLYDGLKNRWTVVHVDEYVPVKDGRLLFAQPKTGELWVIIIEKAFAKFCGSYCQLSGGQTLWALQALTGDPVMQMVRRGNGEWERLDIKHNNDNNKRSVSMYAHGEKFGHEDMFFLARKYVKAGALMGASIDSAKGESKDNHQGLVAGHAYSFLDAKSFKAGKGRINLLRLRNPWGTFEWKGAWSDGAPEWNKHKSIKDLIKPVEADDGAFWIEWEDFCNAFNRIDFCNRSTGLCDLQLDTMESDGCANCIGPCKGCVTGCCTYWVCCKGCKAIYCDHKAQDQTMDLSAHGHHGKDDGLLDKIGITGGKGAPEEDGIER